MNKEEKIKIITKCFDNLNKALKRKLPESKYIIVISTSDKSDSFSGLLGNINGEDPNDIKKSIAIGLQNEYQKIFNNAEKTTIDKRMYG